MSETELLLKLTLDYKMSKAASNIDWESDCSKYMDIWELMKTQLPSILEVPCKDCHNVYIGKTKRTLKVRFGENKQAVRRGDPKNSIAVHMHP